MNLPSWRKDIDSTPSPTKVGRKIFSFPEKYLSILMTLPVTAEGHCSFFWVPLDCLLSTFLQKMWVNESSYQGIHCEDGEEGFQDLVFNIRKQKTDCNAFIGSFHWKKKIVSLLNLRYFTQYHLPDQKSCISAISSTLWSTCRSWIWNTYWCCPDATSKMETHFLNSCWILCTTEQSQRVSKFAGTRT